MKYPGYILGHRTEASTWPFACRSSRMAKNSSDFWSSIINHSRTKISNPHQCSYGGYGTVSGIDSAEAEGELRTDWVAGRVSPLTAISFCFDLGYTPGRFFRCQLWRCSEGVVEGDIECHQYLCGSNIG
jgi:hypothetical protein